MYSVSYEGINSCLVGLSSLLLENGKKRQISGKTCFELPEPIMIKIIQPTSRLVTISKRKWNKFLPFAEALWIAGGYNNLDMIKHYLPKMQNFSDDGKYLRGAYGPRIRRFNNSSDDYKADFSSYSDSSSVNIDQFQFVVDCFAKDKNTRQAIISIGDPIKDCYPEGNLIKTLDFPCTRTIHFMKNYYDQLDLYVHMRSNDFLWGATAVNIFNYSFMLEYFSAILGFEMGSYYHIVNNMHFYDGFQSCLEELSCEIPNDQSFVYKKTFNTFPAFNKKLQELTRWEFKFRNNETHEIVRLNDDFFDDWAKILYRFKTKETLDFVNPTLNELFVS